MSYLYEEIVNAGATTASMRAVMLIVQECFPFIGSPTYLKAPPHVAEVQEPMDALSLSWIKGLPGKKRLSFLRGQLFVIQIYMGFKVARAQVLHTQQPLAATLKPGGEVPGDKPCLIVLDPPAAHTKIAASA